MKPISIITSKLLVVLLLFSSFSCANRVNRVEVNGMETVQQPNGDLVGEVDRAVLSNGRFEWYNRVYNSHRINEEAVAYLQQHADDIRVEAYIGTWCPDTHRDFPLFMRAADEAGIPQQNIEIIGLDRKKSSGENKAIDRGITRVPTFVVFYGDTEVGRIAENFNRAPEVYLAEIIQDELNEEGNILEDEIEGNEEEICPTEEKTSIPY